MYHGSECDLINYLTSIALVERINKAEIRSEEQSEKAVSCRENLRNEIRLNGSLKTGIGTRTQ